eukprot:gene49988-43271_t
MGNCQHRRSRNGHEPAARQVSVQLPDAGDVFAPCPVGKDTAAPCPVGTDTAALEAIFGPTLVTHSGPRPTSDVLKGKAGVLVYFSAHWCPPCRGFTPKLAEFHKKHARARNFEIVFVSSDQDESAWKHGRAKVMADFDRCAGFPWRPPSFADALGPELLRKNGKKEFYEAYKKLDPDFEIIFSSGDRDAKSARDYFTSDHGDYLMVPYEGKGRDALDERFGVDGIPTLVICAADGT